MKQIMYVLKTCECVIVHRTRRPDKKLPRSVCPASEQCVPAPPSLLVGFLQQTDNRAPAGLPVHLTGHDSSHAGLFHTLSVPCLIYLFIFLFFVLPTRHCLPPSLSTKLSTVCVYKRSPPLHSVTRMLLTLVDFLIYVVISQGIGLFGGPHFP